MSQPVSYRELHSIEDFQVVMDLQARIWSMQPAMVVPTHMLHALAYGGGCLIGADIGGGLVGFVLSFPVRQHGEWILWSHMTGVLPGYQRQEIGLGLKLTQREWALRSGFDTIRWTFDPMQSANARFNLCRLRAMSDVYHPDFYGVMPDELNAGLPSDRLEITWALDSPRVRALDDPEAAPISGHQWQEDRCALQVGATGEMVRRDVDADTPACFVQIPADLAGLKQCCLDVARGWQQALRETMMELFENGYVASDFLVENERHYYVMQKGSE